MVILRKNTVETWLRDSGDFSYDFMHYSFEWHHAIGVNLELSRPEIIEVHSKWVETVTEWQTQKFRSETESLSYTKIFAILLWALCQRPYVNEMTQFNSHRQDTPTFNGTPEQKAEMVSDLLGAPEAVTAFQFCIAVLNHYEAQRIDRKTAFEFRMTEQGRHDLLVMLTSKEVSPIAVYLALEGIYSRD
jgi:hypothetical protein